MSDPCRQIFEDPLSGEADRFAKSSAGLEAAWSDVTDTMSSLQELWTEDARERLGNLLKRTLETLGTLLTDDEGAGALPGWIVARGAILEALRSEGGARARQLAIARTQLEGAIHLARFARESRPRIALSRPAAAAPAPEPTPG